MFQNLKNIFEKVKQENNSEVEIIEEEIHAVSVSYTHLRAHETLR